MTRSRTRYFVIVSLLILVVGLGTGLVAYYVGLPAAASSAGPVELQYVPRDAALVAYADVHGIMISQVRQRLLAVLPFHSSGQKEFEQQTGINIDTDVDRIVGFLTPPDATSSLPISGMALIRGRFNEAKIESLLQTHGGRTDDYKGVRIVTADVPAKRSGAEESLTLGFVEPGLIAIGGATAVKGAIDRKSGSADNITGNDDVMDVVKGFAIDDAWAVGRFDVLTAEAKLPQNVAAQIPAITWFSAAGRIDAGIAGSFRADARDEEAANNLRDMLRAVVAFAKLQTSARPELGPMLDSLQLGGTGKTVTVSFDLSPQMFDQLATALKGLGHTPPTPGK